MSLDAGGGILNVNVAYYILSFKCVYKNVVRIRLPTGAKPAKLNEVQLLKAKTKDVREKRKCAIKLIMSSRKTCILFIWRPAAFAIHAQQSRSQCHCHYFEYLPGWINSSCHISLFYCVIAIVAGTAILSVCEKVVPKNSTICGRHKSIEIPVQDAEINRI